MVKKKEERTVCLMQRIQYLGSDARHEMWAEKRKVKKPRNWRSISGKSRFQTRWKREITFGKRKEERIERKSRGDRRMRDKAQRFVEFWKVRTWTYSRKGRITSKTWNAETMSYNEENIILDAKYTWLLREWSAVRAAWWWSGDETER